MKYQNIGVDLGKRIIKISILEKIDESSEDYQIIDAQKYFVPEDLDLKDYFKFLESSIKEFLNLNNIKNVRINLTVPCDNDNLIANSFRIPRVDENILEDSILIEVESNISIEPKDYTHKFEIVEEFEDSDEILVLSVLMKKTFIEHILDLRKFRWKIQQLEPQFYIGNKVLQNDSTLIDFGFYDTRIYLYEDGDLTDIDVISIGAFDFLDKIEKMYATNLEQSEEILRISYINKPFSEEMIEDATFTMDDDLETLVNQLTEITREITEELKRNIRVMELNNNMIIENFYYSGELTNLKYFTDFISHELDVKMKPLNFLTLTGFDLEEYINDFEESSGVDNSPALSEDLEVQKLMDEFNKVEAFTYSSLANIENNSRFNFLKDIRFHIDRSSLLIGLLCATIFTQVSFWAINKNYDRKIDLGSSYLSEIEDQNSQLEYEIMDLNDNMDRNKTIINRVENLKDKKKWLSDILYVLPGGTPTNTGITDVSIEAGHAILKGYSEDYSSVGYLAMALEDYGEVTITEVGEKTDGGDHRVEGNVKMYKEFIMDITYDHRLINDDDTSQTSGESLDDKENISTDKEESEEIES